LHFIAIRRQTERFWATGMGHVCAVNAWRLRMRHILLTATAAFVAGGLITGAALSQAQPTPPPASTDMPRPGQGWMGWRHGPGQQRLVAPRDMALIYNQPDRQLTPPDVQKIAEGFLLWRGNHSWKVTNVAATPDGPIGFNLSTSEGSVVAKFTMDPHSGQIRRIG
jgi:hypothetical protein